MTYIINIQIVEGLPNNSSKSSGTINVLCSMNIVQNRGSVR